jgi:hypothetical protein
LDLHISMTDLRSKTQGKLVTFVIFALHAERVLTFVVQEPPEVAQIGVFVILGALGYQMYIGWIGATPTQLVRAE